MKFINLIIIIFKLFLANIIYNLFTTILGYLMYIYKFGYIFVENYIFYNS